MNLVFTICSNNYLAQAKTLMDSVLSFNPEFKLIIGLVDERSTEVDYAIFYPAEIVDVKAIGLVELPELCQKYNIVELNTAVKPSFFKYLSERYSCNKIIYLDPDIKLFKSLESLIVMLDFDDILLTPHILTPIPHDGFNPQENIFLNYGIYNLGFIGLNVKKYNVKKFLGWWEERTLTLGYNRVCEGLFVDQLWINLVPLLFHKVKVIKELGYNMAPWNLHERELMLTGVNEEKYLLNDKSDLVFFHFSSYDFKQPTKVCKDFYNRFTFNERPDLIDLYNSYHSSLIMNQVEKFSVLKCLLIASTEQEKKEITRNKKRSSFYLFMRNAYMKFKVW